MLKHLLFAVFLLPLYAAQPLDCVTDFTNSFYEKVEAEDFVASPFSIFTCLSMAHMGARGETQQEMATVLHLGASKTDLADAFSSYFTLFSRQDKDSYKLHIANSLWAKWGLAIDSNYHHLITNHFQASIQNIDFSRPSDAVVLINNWISEKTEEKVTDLLSPSDISEEAALVLANAIYFKGAFQNPFDINSTHQGIFAGTKVSMMEQTAFFPYFETADAQIGALPFISKGPDVPPAALLIVLPKQDHALILPDSTTFRSWLDRLERTRIHIKLPKLTLKTPLDLNPILTKMGLEVSMTPEADFSGINEKGNLYISKALHQAFFALDEAGVTASAATAVVMNMTSSYTPPSLPVEFIVDRPFFFFIVDLQSQMPLFIGRLTNAPES